MKYKTTIYKCLVCNKIFTYNRLNPEIEMLFHLRLFHTNKEFIEKDIEKGIKNLEEFLELDEQREVIQKQLDNIRFAENVILRENFVRISGDEG